jgi:uncharacterized protein YgiM (DUF1202 family)
LLVEEESIMTASKHFCWALILAIIFLFAGCNKKEKTASNPAPEQDLSKQTQTYITNRDTVVKSGPGSQFKSLTRIPRETKIDVVGRDGDWLLVVSKHGNPPGYIDARDADRADEGSKQPAAKIQLGQYVVVADTVVRKGPGPEHAEVAKVSKGTKVTIVGEERGWLKVESRRGNPPGYIDPTYARRNVEK